MAVRGRFQSRTKGEFRYEVEQYKMASRERLYAGSGATWAKLDSIDLGYIRVFVYRESDPAGGFYITKWGPWIQESDLEDHLVEIVEDDYYSEVVG